MKYWLIKSEPTTYSIDNLHKDGHTSWEGVRNYQARNFMRDELKANMKLAGMLVIRKGQRLSVQPVDRTHFDEVVPLATGQE